MADTPTTMIENGSSKLERRLTRLKRNRNMQLCKQKARRENNEKGNHRLVAVSSVRIVVGLSNGGVPAGRTVCISKSWLELLGISLR